MLRKITGCDYKSGQGRAGGDEGNMSINTESISHWIKVLVKFKEGR